MTVREIAAQARNDSFSMASISGEKRNEGLREISAALKNNKEKIFAENARDLEQAEKAGIPAPVYKRLKFDDSKLADVLSGIESLLTLPDPLAGVKLARELDEGLTLFRVPCPIGVIGVIFEARPDALVQIATLCLKSGNCAVLKGGKEAANTNRILYEIIKNAASEAGIPAGFISLIETHEEVDRLLECSEYIDLLIPRGSNAFVQHIMANTNIPVMGHADGICHIYIDRDADMEKAVKITVDAKTQYPAACNAVETLLVHKDVADRFLPGLSAAFKEKHVTLKGDERSVELTGCEPADEQDFRTEYLDYIVSAKIVEDIDEAIAHINRYGSHHTDCIVTENDQAAERFMVLVDSAGVYRNCSTRFADGFRYGFGAEVGISTGKIHARGPVGLEGLITYKYRLYGDGHVVDDYAAGRKAFHFRDMDNGEEMLQAKSGICAVK